jgi:hypothetical protein
MSYLPGGWPVIGGSAILSLGVAFLVRMLSIHQSYPSLGPKVITEKRDIRVKGTDAKWRQECQAFLFLGASMKS